MRVLELFGCSGGMAEGFRRAGLPVTEAYDYDEDACDSYEANHGHRPIRMDVRDLLRMVRGGWSVGTIDLLVADPPCFPAGTQIATVHGRRPIETIEKSDVVLTHRGRWRPVTETFERPGVPLRELTVGHRPGAIRCTPGHPFLTRHRIARRPTGRDDRRRQWFYGEPEWVAARDLRIGDALLSPRTTETLPIPAHIVRTRHVSKAGRRTLYERRCRVDMHSEAVAWLLGLYLAEGHRRGWEPHVERAGITRREVIFSVATHEVPSVQDRLRVAGEHGIVSSHGQGTARVVLNSPDWWAVCSAFGDGAGRKRIPEWVHAMPLGWRAAILDGYVFGDGHSGPNTDGGTQTAITTISEELAWGVARLVESVVGVVPGLHQGAADRDSVILGRHVHCHASWRVRWAPPVGRLRTAVVDEMGGWLPIRAIALSKRCDAVYNLSVEEDESYVADGVAAHNCTPWSRAGKRKGTDDERDMLEDTVAIVRLLRPRFALIANVPGLEDAPNWPIVQKTIGSLSDLWCIDFARFDAADYGVPQHRLRPFWFLHPHWTPHIVWPERTHGSPEECAHPALPGLRSLLPWVTCRQAFQHLAPEDLGSPVRLRWRGENASHPPSKAPRATHMDSPAGTVTTSGNGNGSNLFDGPNHRPSRLDAPARTLTTNVCGDGALLAVDEAATLLVVPHHPPSEIDTPSRTVRASSSTTPDKLLLVNDKHPINTPDEPSVTVTSKGDGQGGQGATILAWPWDRPGTTIQRDPRMAPPGHHEKSFLSDNRGHGPNAIRLSEKAAAILQGFPPGWRFAGATKASRWGQIGQAMPPPLAEAVARQIRLAVSHHPSVSSSAPSSELVSSSSSITGTATHLQLKSPPG